MDTDNNLNKDSEEGDKTFHNIFARSVASEISKYMKNLSRIGWPVSSAKLNTEFDAVGREDSQKTASIAWEHASSRVHLSRQSFRDSFSGSSRCHAAIPSLS